MMIRDEHASKQLISNKRFGAQGEVLGDEVMAPALTDHVLHHCHIVNVRGNSHRMRHHSDVWKALHPNDQVHSTMEAG
jgi:DNA replication protein DnaC